MGNDNSKEAAPSVVTPVGVVITQEVAERWQALHQKQLEEERRQKRGIDVGAGGDARATGTGASSSENVRQIGTAENKTDGTIILEGGGKCEEKPTSTSGVSGSSEEMQSIPIPRVGRSSTFTDNYDNVGKLANMFVHKDTQKFRDDVENGKTLQDGDIDPQMHSSLFIKDKSVSSPITPIYEEVDETVTVDADVSTSSQRQKSNFFDEEAVIGESDIFQEHSEIKGLRIPRATLPVFVDLDPYGNAVIETVNAWKMRETMGREISKNNELWSKELANLQAKIENETQTQEEDLRTRFAHLERHSHASYEHPKVPCGHLASLIKKCYEKNSYQVLKCSHLVHDFVECANKAVG